VLCFCSFRQQSCEPVEMKPHQHLSNNYIILLSLIRYDTLFLTCSKMLMCSQLSLPHGTNVKNLNEKPTNNKPMRTISPVQYNPMIREGSTKAIRSLLKLE